MKKNINHANCHRTKGSRSHVNRDLLHKGAPKAPWAKNPQVQQAAEIHKEQAENSCEEVDKNIIMN
jgi:hypothetical protein